MRRWLLAFVVAGCGAPTEEQLAGQWQVTRYVVGGATVSFTSNQMPRWTFSRDGAPEGGFRLSTGRGCEWIDGAWRRTNERLELQAEASSLAQCGTGPEPALDELFVSRLEGWSVVGASATERSLVLWRGDATAEFERTER